MSVPIRHYPPDAIFGTRHCENRASNRTQFATALELALWQQILPYPQRPRSGIGSSLTAACLLKVHYQEDLLVPSKAAVVECGELLGSEQSHGSSLWHALLA